MCVYKMCLFFRQGTFFIPHGMIRYELYSTPFLVMRSLRINNTEIQIQAGGITEGTFTLCG